MATKEASESEVDIYQQIEACSGQLDRFAFLLKSGIWSDVTFAVGKEKQEFKAHKLILRTASKLLNDIFNENKDQETFIVPDLEPNGFKLMLEFMYTGKCTDNVEDGLAFLNAGTKYEVSELIRECGKLVSRKLTENNALKVYQQALKYKNPELAEKSLKCVCRFGDTIIKSASFLELSAVELANIIARDDLEIANEVLLFEAVIEWARAECSRQKMLQTHKYLRSVLESVIPLIRFPLMDPTEFAFKVASTNVLLTEELVSILLNFSVKQECRASLPPGMFNPKPRSRYTPTGTNFILPRLVQSSSSIFDLRSRRTNGQVEISLGVAHVEQCIRMKCNASIWVSSIGMNSKTTAVSSESVSVQIQVKDANKMVLATKSEAVCQDNNWISKVKHIHFDQPIHIQNDEWYILSFQVISKSYPYNVKNYTAADGVGARLDFNLPDGSRRIVQFEFEEEENAQWTGVNQGFVPEIGFFVD